MSFDHGVAALRRRLQRKGRQGLAQALDKIVTEVTLLGFVSLILMLFQDSLAKICVGYSDTAIKFTMLEHIDGECPCCLANTHGVTKCAQVSPINTLPLLYSTF